MPRFRKRPVEVEAVRLPVHASAIMTAEVPGWLSDALRAGSVWQVPDGVIIATLEGDHLGRWGDWIIKGVKGELYPCKPDIFDATYESAE